jgi:hypothetical protein
MVKINATRWSYPMRHCLVFSLYAPPEHPDATVNQTKADADAAEVAERR